MMTIKDTRTTNNKANFRDLPIGQVYEDTDGVICIKTSDRELDENCIGFINGQWESSLEDATTKVTPLKTTLTIER